MGNKHAVVSIADPGETGKAYSVLKEIHLDATFDALYVVGDQVGRGRSMWVVVTAANTATQKNTTVTNALNA
jgi:microcompartment protein CcmK/EutM